MQLRGFPLLRIGGIQITIDYSWFVIFFLVVYMMAANDFPATHSQFLNWLIRFLAATLLFVSVLVHELAHSMVAVRQGIRVTSIRLFLFGGVAQLSSEPRSGRHEFLMALAGPAASMILATGFIVVSLILFVSGRMPLILAVTWGLAEANLGLALFNMIPGIPLDGGSVLRAFLWERWNDRARATKVVSQIGSSFALFLIILGALQFLFTKSLISGLWLMFIGLFMKQSAIVSYQTVVLRQTLAGVQIRQIMTEHVVGVDWLISVDELVRDYVYKHQFTNFPVFNREEFIGMVSLDEVKQVPKELWSFKQVRDIMTPVEQVPSLKPTDDATEALARMVSDDLGRMPVIENGHLVGIVSRRDIMNLFK
ncbi:MAG TPA: site-2 protease family protein, partial [Acidobacteriota bacterium]|nr:site-2 protease family protein [Acidobacteriota bacterium]